MMGCKWSVARGIAMLIGLVSMLALISWTGQPPFDDDDPRLMPADYVATSFHTAAQRPDPTSELNSILDNFHDAAAKADFDRYFEHWSPVSVFLGTDATERWVGQQFRDFAKPHFESGKGWVYQSRDRHITVAPSNEAAFFDELLDNAKLGVCRGSGVFRKMEGTWWLMQYNLSIPVPNDLAEKVVGLIKEKPKAPETHEKHKE